MYETGYGILPEYQGRGLAVAALRAVVAEARAAGGPRRLHAYPSVDHAASNAPAAAAGFSWAGEVAFEYPPGTRLRSNDWRMDLEAGADPVRAASRARRGQSRCLLKLKAVTAMRSRK